ncbi:metallophosphoesterase [Thiolinea disciformis]|uniref:metallophosphoesterase n=1 Tax=Thiolinea disciformis TaxID=125614 RepID=UPI000363C68D|nr:metallophosphoesterase [Thiolinea disciformis]
MPAMPFKFFSRNLRGRDFVVGDIHGHFSALESLLGQVHFDGRKDRLFSVGDLVDRGPESWRLIEFLNHPWFHAIRGNHEQMLLDSADSFDVKDNWIVNNGGEWWKDIPPALHERIRTVVSDLPLAFEIMTALGRVGVVHADIPPTLSWSRFVTLLSSEKEVFEQALWSRHRFRNMQLTGRLQPILGIDLVIFGHTPVSKPIQNSNICYIDTGAAYPNEKSLGHLTLAEIHPTFGFHQFSIKNGKMVKTLTGRKERAEQAPA